MKPFNRTTLFPECSSKSSVRCLPLKVVHLMSVLSLLSILFIRLVLKHLHAFTPTCFILTGLCYCIQLTHLVLKEQKGRKYMWCISILFQPKNQITNALQSATLSWSDLVNCINFGGESIVTFIKNFFSQLPLVMLFPFPQGSKFLHIIGTYKVPRVLCSPGLLHTMEA